MSGPGAEGVLAAGGQPARPVDQGVNRSVNPAGRRRVAVDPVKVLLHRHRALCERAVDPLEIAAGLEAHGVTDRTAARFRHRDVFSLAEELYARVPRPLDGPDHPGGPAAADPADRAAAGPGTPAEAAGPLAALPGSGWERLTLRRRALGYAAALAPGALALTARLLLAGPAAGTGTGAAVVTAAGAVAVLAALAAALRLGPLRAAGRAGLSGWLWAPALTAAVGAAPAVLATGSGAAAAAGATAAGTLTGLALGVAPGIWCGGLFAGRARRRLAGSRVLDDFAAGVRPLLIGVTALFAAAQAGLLVLTGGSVGTGTALAVLLLLARLLAVHGYPAAARNTCGVLAATGTALLAAGVLGAPVPGSAFTALCATGALALLGHAAGALSRASAHLPAGGPG
ncbi:hypothetical protein [Streptomyces sp. NPDC089919]|uniref:hypothetical protein n=1 Tax=Streptomyces sp. NPDC089919 TaxID=3155188 RepID=UPI00343F2812